MCKAAYLARVDRKTVILVMDPRFDDIHTDGVTNIKRISVVSTQGITVRVVDGNVSQSDVIRLNTKRHKGSVLDIQSSNGRGVKAMSVEELGLLLSAGPLAVPPPRTVAVDEMA